MKINNTKIFPNGKGVFEEGSNEYLGYQRAVGTRKSSGPSGRRKTNQRNILASRLAASVRLPILYCNDQHKCLGTGKRPKIAAVG